MLDLSTFSIDGSHTKALCEEEQVEFQNYLCLNISILRKAGISFLVIQAEFDEFIDRTVLFSY